MIVKTGIDIIEVNRIKENIEKYAGNFLNKIFTEKEIEYCESKKVQKYQSYAARFAAKEAVFKAISEFLKSKYDIEWKSIEVLNDKNGRPFVKLNINSSVLCENVNVEDFNKVVIDISISHLEETAVASVVVIF